LVLVGSILIPSGKGRKFHHSDSYWIVETDTFSLKKSRRKTLRAFTVYIYTQSDPHHAFSPSMSLFLISVCELSCPRQSSQQSKGRVGSTELSYLLSNACLLIRSNKEKNAEVLIFLSGNFILVFLINKKLQKQQQ
jgi:hypothetical protein